MTWLRSRPARLQRCRPTQVNKGLTTDQVAAMTTTAQVGALTTDQIKKGLTTDQIVGLTTAQVVRSTPTRCSPDDRSGQEHGDA